MRKIALILIAVNLLVFASCSNSNEPIVKPVEAKKVTNLHAPQKADYTTTPPSYSGAFTKFSFKEGKEVTGDNWDIAFRGLRIIVNGGAKYSTTDADEPNRTGKASLAVVKKAFNQVTMAPADSDFHQDATGAYALANGGNAWYTYNGLTHVVTANAGTVIVVKTIDGNYAKMEISSYYKDAPEKPSKTSEARYYTFDYVYNPNVGDKSFE